MIESFTEGTISPHNQGHKKRRYDLENYDLVGHN